MLARCRGMAVHEELKTRGGREGGGILLGVAALRKGRLLRWGVIQVRGWRCRLGVVELRTGGVVEGSSMQVMDGWADMAMQ